MKGFLKIIFLYFLLKTISCLDKEKDCQCKILPESKIVGGKQSHHLAYPWVVSISSEFDETPNSFRDLVTDEKKINFHECGGTILNERWILTAAHCIPKNKTQPMYVGFGNDNDLVKIYNSGRIKSARIIKYPGFRKEFFKNYIWEDIALIELEKPIQFSDNVKPACFLKKYQEMYSGYLDHSGWGSTETFKISIDEQFSSSIKLSRFLKEISLIDKSDKIKFCQINGRVICAKGVYDGESSCKGDSGSPIHYTQNGKSYVVGLTSFGNKIYKEKDYNYFCYGTTVYTRISCFLIWIRRNVVEDICDF